MNLTRIAGKYRETGHWKSSDGTSGNLRDGIVEICFKNNRIEFTYSGDEEVQISEVIDSLDEPIPIKGKLGPGRLLIEDSTLILEYEADIEGRAEQNTDIWVFRDNLVSRHGLIRQDDRIIWFEALMHKL